MLDSIAYYFVRFFNLLYHVLPIRFDLWLGRRYGVLFYLFSKKRSRIMYANLKAAFAKEKTPQEIKCICKKVYTNMAQTFVEILAMTKADKKYLDKYVTIDNLEKAQKAAQNPTGVIFLTAHLGNWEMLAAKSFQVDLPLYVLGREQKMKRLNELLNKMRESRGNIVIRKGLDIKNIFRVLQSGKIVGILADQNAGPTGHMVEFFGRKASSPSGPYRFAQKCKSYILPAFIHRVEGPYHKVELADPIFIEESEDILPYMQKYNDLLEQQVRKYPDQWLWMHKKWKLTPEKSILILDDGKKGHLKQSLVMAEALKKYRENQGTSPADTKMEIIKVRFKSKSAKTWFNLKSPFYSYRCQGCLKCLKNAVDEQTYRKLSSKYADSVISCGSNLFAVNKILKFENNAKNLTVFDPGRLNRKSFDLIVLPRHDVINKHIKVKDNIIVTELAPTLIDPSSINKMRKEFPLQQKPCVGLLFGGDNSDFVFSKGLTEKIADGISEALKQTGATLYATTSRRTPMGSETVLKDTLTGKGQIIIGRSDNDELTVEKILAKSDCVVVSGESISMVSEAVSSLRPVLVFMPEKRNSRITKYEKFVKRLEKDGYIKCVPTGKISEEIKRIINSQPKVMVPDDDEKIYAKIHWLL